MINKKNKIKLLLLIFIVFTAISWKIEASEELPKVTICPAEIVSGEEIIYLEGTALPNNRFFVILDRDGTLIKEWEVVSNTKGEWSFWENKLLKSGIYKVYFKNERGDITPSSCFIKVSLSGITIYSWIITYKNLALITLLFLFFLLSVILYFLWRNKKTRISIERESLDLKKKFYKEYNELEKDIESTLKMFRQAKANRKLNTKEKQLEQNLLKNLNDVKEVFKKELKDIEEIK